MTRLDVNTVSARGPRSSLLRLLSCIRLDEVCVLQGAPMIGVCFGMDAVNVDSLLAVAALIAGNLCLVAHVFVLNDWAGIQGDLKDPNRAAWSFVAKGENSMRIGYLALILLVASLLLFSLLGTTAFAIACVIAALSAVYSLPGIHGKGIPVLNSLLHFFGGTLHFLLGFSAFSAISLHGVLIGCFFGLVFTAGHFTHETRDHDGDLRSGIRTNAVAFGKRRSFFAGFCLFSVAYGLLTVLALLEIVPAVLSLAGAFYVIHLRASLRAWRSGLTFQGIRRLQTTYRNIHVVIGLAMLVTVPPWPVGTPRDLFSLGHLALSAGYPRMELARQDRGRSIPMASHSRHE